MFGRPNTPLAPQKGFTYMAKSKADLLAEAKGLGLEVTEKNTVAEITAAIAAMEAAPAPEAVEEVVIVTEDVTATDKPSAKAGKRSEKAQREAAELAEKEARKEAGDTSSQDGEEATKKGPKPVTRTRL